MVDALVSGFVERLVVALEQKSRIILEFQDQFEEMKQNLKLMQGFLKDVDRMRRKEGVIGVVADELRELIYDAEDILEACSYVQQVANQKQVITPILKWLSPMKIHSRYKIGKQLSKFNEGIKNMYVRMSGFLNPALTIQSREEEFSSNLNRWTIPIFDETQIVGLEGDANKIKGWLFQATEGLLPIGFVGMGGLGKTTTAQKVFNDIEVQQHFDKKIWVSVSRPVEEEKIMRTILKDLGDMSIGDDRGELLQKIHQYLVGKRYLLVLDDVWVLDGGWWTRLVQGLPKGNGSCVVITTRKEQVAQQMGVVKERIHRPKLLTEDESWSLFSKIAYAGRSNMSQDPAFIDIGMQIVRKCGGLPLAIKAVAGLMSWKAASISEWSQIADNFRDELKENQDLVMASLQLSYDELPAYLKPCFLCFSIYPEDSVILKDQLIRWWIGEGFVPMKKGKLLAEAGEDCFMNLVNRCLVAVVDKGYDGKVYTCKIHDMVRDLVIKMGETEAFCKLDGSRSRRVSMANGVDENHLTTSSLKLRVFVSKGNIREVSKVRSAFAEKLCDCHFLRVLDLSESIFETHCKVVLSKIGSLQHLTYLSLRNTHPMIEVPDSIGKLVHLQVLDLSFCQNLKMLPVCISNLKRLMVLDASCCGTLKHFPKGLKELSNLQVLKGFKPPRSCYTDGCCFGELSSLTQLRTLEMLITRPDEIANDEFEALLPLHQLQHLTISCFDSCDADLAPKLENLSLPPVLCELILKFYPGESTPFWLNPNSLPKLQYLSISSGNFRHFNQRFYGTENMVWKLEGLMLESLPDLEEEWSRLHQAMPFLRLMSVSWCHKLETFPIEDVGFKGSVWRRSE